MNLSLILFLIGILGFVLNRKNIILMLISIEIMLLSITFLILVSSINLDDIIGQTYAVYIIVIAGAESAIGLAILVAFYRLSFLKLFYDYLVLNFPIPVNLFIKKIPAAGVTFKDKMNSHISVNMADSKRFYSTFNDQPNLLNNNLILDP